MKDPEATSRQESESYVTLMGTRYEKEHVQAIMQKLERAQQYQLSDTRSAAWDLYKHFVKKEQTYYLEGNRQFLREIGLLDQKNQPYYHVVDIVLATAEEVDGRVDFKSPL